MALSGPAAVPARAPAPRIRVFATLKLRVMRNSLRGAPRRIVLFVLGIVSGLVLAGAGFLVLAGTGTAPWPLDYLVAEFIGSGVVLGWLLMPLLFFGVDETLDPARFALLPVPPRTLVAGMLTAAVISVPALATLVALLGLVVSAGARGWASVPVALAGVLLAMLLCLVGSRALTSALAAMLRSRRVRDLAVVLLALLASSIAPIQWVLPTLISRGSAGPALRVAGVLGWTPLGAGFVAPFDAATGHPARAALRLSLLAATVLALLWWWSRTLESAMTGVAAGAPVRVHGGGAASPVAMLFPRWLAFARRHPWGAVAARESRYWWRDPRRRANLISMTVAGGVVPVAFVLAGRAGGGTPLPVAVTVSGVLAGLLLVNQFGFDGSAYAAHLLVGVRGRVELAARSVGLLVVVGPLLAAVTVLVALAAGAPGGLAPALGTLVAAMGTGAGVAMIASVRTAYPLPDNANPFATNSGGSSAKGLLSLLGMAVSMLATAPVTAAALLVPDPWSALVLPAGAGYGLLALVGGARVGGDALDRRAPELLVAVTPRR